MAFWQLLEQFFRPILDLSEKYNIMQAAMASSERVFTLLDTKATIVDPKSPVELPHVRGEIRFDNVSFAYNEGDWVLRDVDLTISAGESVAIVGATGAGKTSIISLISRFYDVQKGRILLDGVDLRDMRQADVRRHVGVVLQDPFIFAGHDRVEHPAERDVDQRRAGARGGAVRQRRQVHRPAARRLRRRS